MNIVILGDSYSTFKGYIPERNETYYPNEAAEVTSVKDTWWYLLSDKLKAHILLNDSWLGTTVCNTGWNKRYCPEDSFIGRFDKLVDDGFFQNNDVDKLFIFGGTNDCWSGAPLGEIKTEGITEENEEEGTEYR